MSTPFVIGKPSHATGVHPGTRMEERHGYLTYHCPQPCGQQFMDLAKIRAHVKRTAWTKYWGAPCAVTIAARSTRKAAIAASMTDEQLAAAFARLSAAS